MFTHIAQDAITAFTQAVTPTTIITTGATLTHRVEHSVTHTMIATATIGLRADIKQNSGKIERKGAYGVFSLCVFSFLLNTSSNSLFPFLRFLFTDTQLSFL
jgi:hypothetical protein